LIQQYAKRIRFSAFGYLNDSNLLRDGGVLRARQKFVGPMQPQPGLPDIANTKTEWDANTGVFIGNPDSTDAADTATLFGVAVSNSGVINYLNKFGEINPGSYKTYDPVSELYYAAVRYFKNLGNVPDWIAVGSASTSTKATWVDGFPVIASWDDPIQYSCQKNYILGVGDANTHADKNVPGSTTPTGNEPTKPSSIVSDTSVNAVTATDKVGSLEGLGGSLGSTNPYNGCCNNNSALIAGLAYDSHTKDIRPDNAGVSQTKGMQTINTYWLDVLEYGAYKPNNQYFLATKYGGFKVPDGYSPYSAGASAPDESAWHNNSETLFGTSNKRPDNYFYASKADQMISGLTAAFASIASDMKANSTGLAVASPQLTATDNAAYSARYDASNWTGEITASELTLSSSLALVLTQKWKASDKLAAQFAGTGWNTDRRVVSWNGSSGVPFRSTGSSTLAPGQLSALDTSYGANNDSTEYLNYLRGDRTNEQGSTASGAKGYRARSVLLGDISGSKTTAVKGPGFPYSDAANPGYAAFKTTYASRTPMVYVGANDGMLHAFYGSISSTDGGKELFAYVPSALFNGPTAAGTDGLAALGNPGFTHHYYVDGTARAFDVNLSKTAGATATTPDWRTLLIGGLGKGGKSFYAIDVTNPGNMTTESGVAQKVMWEFPNANTPSTVTAKLGFSYGAPIVTKTTKYGWVVIFTSGYNNTDGGGYFFIVNPRNGALLETVSTGSGSATVQTGLAHAVAYVQDYSDNLAESLYAGDLLGNVWRVDLRGTSGSYAAATKIATLGTSNLPQPVTTAPSVGIHPKSGVRYVMIGTGRLLADSDIATTETQSFYSIADGTTTRFNAAADLPSTVSFPITKSNLVPLTNTLAGITVDASRPMGWYFDFSTAANGIASRMVVNSNTFNGVVAFASTLPSGDACSPSGTSDTYGVDIATAKSRLVENINGTETLVGLIHRDDVVAEIFIVGDPPPTPGQQQAPGNAITIGYKKDAPESIRLKRDTSNSVSRINWRQIKLPN